jgi:hypothetical protein
MLQLNGIDQYAYRLAESPPQGASNQAPLGRLVGYPQWWMADVRPANTTENRWVVALSASAGLSRCALQWKFGNFTRNDAVAEQSAIAGTEDVFQRVLVYMASRTSTIVYVNGVGGTEYTTDSGWYTSQDILTVGARAESSNFDLFFTGDLANVAFGSATLSAGQRTGCIPGVNPLSYPGVLAYYPLLADANDYFGTWNLTTVGSPTFTATGHPEVEAWPPSGGSGVSRSRLVNAGAG